MTFHSDVSYNNKIYKFVIVLTQVCRLGALPVLNFLIPCLSTMVLVDSICSECGISKESLKSEIISELLPLIKSPCFQGDSNSSLDPSDVSCPLLPNIREFFHESVAILTDFQQQIDFNVAQFEQAKFIYRAEVDYLHELTSGIEFEVKKLNDKAKKIDESIDGINDDLEKVAHEVERGEMYSRRNTIEIHGIPESKHEVTNNVALDVFSDMGLDVNFRDICRSHRTKRSGKKTNRPRPIYVKMVNHDLKDEIMKSKNKLRSN